MSNLRGFLRCGALLLALPLAAQTPSPAGPVQLGRRLPVPPVAPLITEPGFALQVVNPSDVHMETEFMEDQNLTDTHLCSDWQIVVDASNEVVWRADCVTGPEKIHAHFGDGTFQGSHAGFDALLPELLYRVRVRHRDSTFLWSPWSERIFETAPLTAIVPMEEDDASPTPTPTWRDETGVDIELPFGANSRSALVEAFGVGPLLGATGLAGPGNTALNFDELDDHGYVRVWIGRGPQAFFAPPSRIAFTNHEGEDRVIYLPALNLGPDESAIFWVDANGGTYVADTAQVEPDFSDLARSAPVPWRIVEPGFQVDQFATGLRMPVNVAFAPNPGTQAGDPRVYVTELYGSIKVITNDGTVSDYVSGLLNFTPTGNFPGNGELGVSGIAVDPATGDLFVGYLTSASGSATSLVPRVSRFTSLDGGLTAATETILLEMPAATQGQSHFISNITIGPDGKLYVHMGDGFVASDAQNLNSYRGKILRMNLDGSVPPDNPWAGGVVTARDYVWVRGLRNPFGGCWWSGGHFFVENGPGSNDRLGLATAGANFGWNGSDASMTNNAIYNWAVPRGPVNIAFVEDSVFGGSGYPAEWRDLAYVTESGPTWASGPQAQGKRIVAFDLTPGGSLVSGPTPIVEYTGSGKATAVALAAGPDGLYFSDFYKDSDFSGPTDVGSNLLRLRFVGSADFTVSPASGPPPLVTQFTNTSNLPGQYAWSWDFGDGTTSSLENPFKIYSQAGVYSVRLEVTGTNGIDVVQKNGLVFVGATGSGLMGSYYNGQNFDSFVHQHLDPVVDFDWGTGVPHSGVGNDNFSVRWEGYVLPPVDETYTFLTTTDDGARLWVDGQLLVDEWVDQSATTHSGTIALTGGQMVEIKMEMYENGVDASAKLEWQSPSLARQVIPSANLFP